MMMTFTRDVAPSCPNSRTAKSEDPPTKSDQIYLLILTKEGKN